MTEIRIPFGREIYNTTLKPVLHKQGLTNKEMSGEISEVFTKLVYEALEAEGYSKNAIGRMWFEEALDWYCRLTAPTIVSHFLKLHKVPKFLILKIRELDYEE